MHPAKPGLIIGFHGCDQSVCDIVISGQTMLTPSRNGYDWLAIRLRPRCLRRRQATLSRRRLPRQKPYPDLHPQPQLHQRPICAKKRSKLRRNIKPRTHFTITGKICMITHTTKKVYPATKAAITNIYNKSCAKDRLG